MPTPDPSKAGHARALRIRLVLLIAVLIALACLAGAWSWSPLRAWLDVDRIVSGLQEFGQSFGPLAAVCGFAFALTLAVPLTFLTLVTVVAFGPLAGFCISIIAAVIGAAVSYWIGELLGHPVLVRMGGQRVNIVSERLAARGILAVVAVRMVPIAPFAIVNMIAGASHISLRDLLVGTAIGMTPGTLGMIFFVDPIVEALRNPGPATFVLAALMITLIGIGLWALRRWLRQTLVKHPDKA
jgi:uncharacterized membrane protein YdjX (TVP38/TMEM64 family)